MDKKRPSGEQNLVTWARPYLADKRKLYQLADPRLELNYSLKAVQKVSQLAYNCLHRDPKSRPTMDEIVKVLTPLQDLNDLAILSYHARLSQQGRRKKKPEGSQQLSNAQSKSIRDSPLNNGKQRCRWSIVSSCHYWLNYQIKQRLGCHSCIFDRVKTIFQACCIILVSLKFARGKRIGRGKPIFISIKPYTRELTMNVGPFLVISQCCNWDISCN